MIKGDSTDYDLLEKWCKNFDCQGYKTVEIGVREGMGSYIMMEYLKNYFVHIGIYPYSNLKYQHYDNTGEYQCDYTDAMWEQLMRDMKPYEGKFNMLKTTDVEFMNTPTDSKFAFVHFDGPHRSQDVLTEAIWFANRSAPHTRFVFDDYKKYKMDVIAYALTIFNFKTIEAGGNKICLEKKP